MGDPMWSGGEKEVVRPHVLTGELLHCAEVGPGFLDVRGVWMTLPGVSMARGEVGEGGQESGEGERELSLHMSALNNFLLRVELDRLLVSSWVEEGHAGSWKVENCLRICST